MIIDAMCKLKPSHINDLVKDKQDDTKLVAHFTKLNTDIELDIAHIRQFFMTASIRDLIADDEIIDLTVDDMTLRIAAADYRWWTETVRNKEFARLDKLLNDKSSQEQEPKKRRGRQTDTTIYKVAVSSLDDKGFISEDIEFFEGLNNEVIEFVNKAYSKRQLKSYFNEKTIFCFYNNEDELLELSNWKTLEDLANEGKVTLV